MGALIRPTPADRPPPASFTLPHGAAATAHAVTRLRERYGRRLGPADVALHEDAIASGESRRISTGGLRELREVIDGGRAFYPVWCLRLRRIVTYLTPPADPAERARDPKWRGL